MDRPQSRWIPSETTTRHSGANIPEDMEFFVAPPPDIGPVLTAESTLRCTSHSMSARARLFWTLIVTGVTTLIVVFLLGPFTIVVTLMAGGLTFLALGFSATCSYVGERGIAEFFLYNSRSATPASEILVFDDATQLWTKQTRRFRGRVYQGTSYTYRWVRRDRTEMMISGLFRDLTGWPQDDDRWHFANSAEGVWTSYLLPTINRELEHSGYVEFPMAGKLQAIRLKSGLMEVVTRTGETQTVNVEEMREVKLVSGEFHFKHKDVKEEVGKDWYSVAYRDMPNAKLFLLCLEQVAGVAWSS